MKKVIEGTIAGLVYVNRNAKNYCEISDLVPNWKTILSEYMASHYLRCVSYDIHNSYYIAIDYLIDDSNEHDTLAVLNAANITIDSIDYIINSIVIRFKDESSRDLVFNVLNVWEWK